MAIALIDTNILIDAVKGIPETRTELLHYTDIAISNITYIEFVVGLRTQLHLNRITPAQYAAELALVSNLQIIHIDQRITDAAIDIRSLSILGSGRSVKLPDALILATANVSNRYMVTRDPGGFTGPNVRIPYQLDADGHVINVNSSPPA